MNGGIFPSIPHESCLLNMMTTVFNSVLAKLTKTACPYAFHTLISTSTCPQSHLAWPHLRVTTAMPTLLRVNQLHNLKALGQPGTEAGVPQSVGSVPHLSDAVFLAQAQMLNRKKLIAEITPVQCKWSSQTIPYRVPRGIP